eukprot:TRINITY_DN77272_c0_g1_i1.p3 TRINITY_DN77272_c0_g1~~TRINITY_DN77272_c0_g1_i1.p3  ORF type:complete len:122 (+),score=3.95 TRINITY_DN77272_c0_g1_i1:22-387(+)
MQICEFLSGFRLKKAFSSPMQCTLPTRPPDSEQTFMRAPKNTHLRYNLFQIICIYYIQQQLQYFYAETTIQIQAQPGCLNIKKRKFHVLTAGWHACSGERKLVYPSTFSLHHPPEKNQLFQ